jgi:hypothetical protein
MIKATDILDFADLKEGTVEVPEWKTTLTIRELGLDQGLSLYSMVQSLSGNQVVMKGQDIAQVIAWSVVNPETGERVFSDADVPALAKKNRNALMRIYTAITSLTGEDAEKN